MNPFIAPVGSHHYRYFLNLRDEPMVDSELPSMNPEAVAALMYNKRHERE
jgi:hypothetical protein